MKDGRSKPPPPPDEYYNEMMAAGLNAYFRGGLYRPEHIPHMPQMWLDKMAILINSNG